MSSTSTQSPLPPKENTLFKSIVRCYETKQYKKGLKAAETILKKFPDHGETLAMKGLTLNCLNRKQEGYEYVRRGLKSDLKSHVCWHVYGLLYRSDRDYNEAIKCYRNALKLDKDNLQILRDLGLLQIQMRDVRGFIETKRTLLTLKPNNRNHWIGFVVAQHMGGFFRRAVDVLNAYQGTLDEILKPDYENSEMLLYKTMIYEESGDFQGAYDELIKSDKIILDRLAALEMKAQVCLGLKHFDEAREAYSQLLAINSENLSYHHGLQSAEQLRPLPKLSIPSNGSLQAPSAVTVEDIPPSSLDKMLQLYLSLAVKFPKSNAVRRLALDFASGEDFAGILDAFVRPFLVKGVPSLFSDLKSLYKNPAKVQAIEALFLSYVDSLQKSSSFPPLTPAPTPTTISHPEAAAPQENHVDDSADSRRSGSIDPSGSQEKEKKNKTDVTVSKEEEKNGVAKKSDSSSNTTLPSVLLWTLFFLAQHFDAKRELDVAMRYIDQAIAHTPTVVDLYLVKARIYKHLGDLERAFEFCDRARQMDLADRFLNSKATLYALRAGHTEQAEKTIALFTKEGDTGSTASHLFDMQCMWYELECGDAYTRANDLGRALKKYLAVDQHFADITEDQFDFHTYCLRKMTLRSYVRLLRMEDTLRSHKFYFRAALGIIRSYLRLYDNPKESAESAEARQLAGLSESERKKAVSKLKREKARAKAGLSASESAPVSSLSTLTIQSSSATTKDSSSDQPITEEETISPPPPPAPSSSTTAAPPTSSTTTSSSLTSSAEQKKTKGKAAKGNTAAAVPADDDPAGEKLLQVEDPLKEATKYLKNLQEYCGDKLETHLVGFEVYMRREKLLLALRAVKKMACLAGPHPDVRACLERFLQKLKDSCSTLSPVVIQVLSLEAPSTLLDNTSSTSTFQPTDTSPQQNASS
mmetsp:Transcript_28646/g.46406  ORF Transcript_28646/g.46406 Transcript_28646/m.46406 type:complete len:923 (-) Transcript_28646:67-2835(-)|eukprot:CAMPEP_0184674400 /NCGR_PEP_ID=MMETSP0308-20130426/87214_1 /TAXON_ID=38269 /ORGANISM="Gloeochaete witrockiana, Strain SAG 46.84" /LENGTH=922 /DNA_ID=CAMNT_0027121993 /DNA_START=87 /DNA_END=2855 /DNA_ORIENTATION=-